MKSLHVLALIGAILFCGALAASQGSEQFKMEVKTELAPSYAVVVGTPLTMVHVSEPTGEVIKPLAGAEPIAKVQKGFVMQVFHPPLSFSNS